MVVSKEILQQIQDAQTDENPTAVAVWQSIYNQVETLTNAQVISQRPVEQAAKEQPTETVVSTSSPLVEKLRNKLKKDVKLPEPRPELLEMQRILEAEGFNMEPIVYLVGKDKVAYALLDRAIRPRYEDGKQLFEDDGYVPILERGRASGKIEVTDWTRAVPAKSRFGVSWGEVHNFVAPEVLKASTQLAKLVEATDAQLRVTTKEEFQFAGRLRYAHFGEANTWEWLYDNAGFGNRLVGGSSGHGGLRAVYAYRPDYHHDFIAFRLQLVLPPQKA